MRAARNTDLRHFPKVEHFVDFFRRQNLFALYEISNKDILLDGLLADLRGSRVTDLRRQSGGKSSRTLEPVLTLLLVRFHAFDGFLRQHADAVAQYQH